MFSYEPIIWILYHIIYMSNPPSQSIRPVLHSVTSLKVRYRPVAAAADAAGKKWPDIETDATHRRADPSASISGQQGVVNWRKRGGRALGAGGAEKVEFVFLELGDP